MTTDFATWAREHAEQSREAKRQRPARPSDAELAELAWQKRAALYARVQAVFGPDVPGYTWRDIDPTRIEVGPFRFGVNFDDGELMLVAYRCPTCAGPPMKAHRWLEKECPDPLKTLGDVVLLHEALNAEHRSIPVPA